MNDASIDSRHAPREPVVIPSLASHHPAPFHPKLATMPTEHQFHIFSTVAPHTLHGSPIEPSRSPPAHFESRSCESPYAFPHVTCVLLCGVCQRSGGNCFEGGLNQGLGVYVDGSLLEID
ncbi:hypothetical protein KC367_g49 [Hortaea werneckii]|nr:hypothetical protein KC367_g49 [Hortaea werneckii]